MSYSNKMHICADLTVQILNAISVHQQEYAQGLYVVLVHLYFSILRLIRVELEPSVNTWCVFNFIFVTEVLLIAADGVDLLLVRTPFLTSIYLKTSIRLIQQS